MAISERFFKTAARLETAQAVIENLNGDGLRIDWRIERDNTNRPDQAEITIFGSASSIHGKIYDAWRQQSQASGYLITFSIGWDGVARKAVRGDVWDIVANRITPTENMMILKVGDGNKKQRDNVVKKSFVDVNLSIFLEYIVVKEGGLELIYPKESRALVKQAQSELPVQTFGNMPAGIPLRDAVDFVMATLGLEWRVQNGAFIAMRGGVINRPGPILRPSTGLLNYEISNDGGVRLDALANPDVEPGMQIQVQDNNGVAFGAPLYRVDKVVFSGSTQAENVMEIQARKSLAA